MTELTHLSYSSISLYQTCPRAWQFRYIDGIRSRPTAALVMGTAFHNSVEDIIRALAMGEDSNPTEIWTRRWAEVQDQEPDYQGELPEELSNMGLRMLTAKSTVDLLDSIMPMLDENGAPVIEKRVELRVPGVPIPVIGFIDVILATGAPADFKTAARMWTAEKAREELQPVFYLAALNQAGYTQNPTHEFCHFVFTKTARPQAAAFSAVHSPAEWLWLFGAIQAVWKGIAAGVFPPNPSSWKCSDRWCDQWAMCRGRR